MVAMSVEQVIDAATGDEDDNKRGLVGDADTLSEREFV